MQVAAMSARWWPSRRSAHAAAHGTSTAEASIAAARVQAQITPADTPKPPVAKTSFST
jgi:hypothetical protein